MNLRFRLLLQNFRHSSVSTALRILDVTDWTLRLWRRKLELKLMAESGYREGTRAEAGSKAIAKNSRSRLRSVGGSSASRRDKSNKD